MADDDFKLMATSDLLEEFVGLALKRQAWLADAGDTHKALDEREATLYSQLSLELDARIPNRR